MKITVEVSGKVVTKELDDMVYHSLLKTATSLSAYIRYMLIEAGEPLEDLYTDITYSKLTINGVDFIKKVKRPIPTDEREEEENGIEDRKWKN